MMNLGLTKLIVMLTIFARPLARGNPICAPCEKTCLLGYVEDTSDSICLRQCVCRKDGDMVDDIKLHPSARNFMITSMGTDDDLVANVARVGMLFDASRADVIARWEYPGLNAKWRIPYVIGNVSTSIQMLIQEAIADYEAYICMEFVERTTEESYLHFMDIGTGCWSYVGRRLDDINYINLPTTCAVKGTVIHEIMHALGFFHEHQRPDRDSYIIVYESAIDPEAISNFLAFTYDVVDYFIATSVPYDIGSVMQYSDDAFSMTGAKTLALRNGQPFLAQRDGFAYSDILQLQLMYQCEGVNLTLLTTTPHTSKSINTKPPYTVVYLSAALILIYLYGL